MPQWCIILLLGNGGVWVIITVIYLCSIQYFNDSAEHWVVFIFVFLADELDVSQLSKVKVSLFLQSLYCQLHIQELEAKSDQDNKLCTFWEDKKKMMVVQK